MLSILRPVWLGASLLALLTAPSFAADGPANPVQKAGHYAVELRLPPGGVVAGTEVDLEFRVTDTDRDDPIQGAAPVVRATVAATATMPIMPGMPPARPKIHAEGVPGDYGLVATFPHGGDYRLTLTITPLRAAPFTVAFPLSVRDAGDGPRRAPQPPAYTLAVAPATPPVAGQPSNLIFTITGRDGKPVTQFDEVHTRLIHLVIVRRDLQVFSHEHPTFNPATGTFSLTYTFPTAGDWRLFADMAPRGAGGQVAAASLRVDGTGGGAASAPLVAQARSSVGDMTLALSDTAPLARRTLPLHFTLRDGANKPITNLEPWLGAIAHLILITGDATTFVHCHPDETDPASGHNGTLTFLARFPRPGVYKGWVQFQRAGKIVTLPFVVRAGGDAR